MRRTSRLWGCGRYWNIEMYDNGVFIKGIAFINIVDARAARPAWEITGSKS